MVTPKAQYTTGVEAELCTQGFVSWVRKENSAAEDLLRVWGVLPSVHTNRAAGGTEREIER